MDQADRDRKRAWKAQMRDASRAAFPVPDELLKSLFASVEDDVETIGCDHSMRFTEEWIAQGKQSREPLIAWLKENGGYCDCEVVANARDHWEQNR